MPKANDKDVYYFSHDCNARNDEKILALRSVHGLEGYAIYFMLIEILREQPTYRLPITKYVYNTLAMQMQCECSKIELVVHDCCNEFISSNSALLKIEDGYLYSESLMRRMEKVDGISESRTKAALARWGKENQCKGNANAQQKKCYKKRIDKNKKEEMKEKQTAIDVMFDEFWEVYPKKIGKAAAKKAYLKITVTDELHHQMLASIASAINTDAWTKDDGQYIPYPASWLNGGRWEDEYLPPKRVDRKQDSNLKFVD